MLIFRLLTPVCPDSASAYKRFSILVKGALHANSVHAGIFESGLHGPASAYVGSNSATAICTQTQSYGSLLVEHNSSAHVAISSCASCCVGFAFTWLV